MTKVAATFSGFPAVNEPVSRTRKRRSSLATD
jgi:hypothetical protein